jgi:hypothetical protein
MAHNPEWHAEYARLELAEDIAREAFRSTRRALDRKRVPAGAQEAHDAALIALRAAGKARFDFEMAATTIVNIADLPPREFYRALWPNRAGQ